MAGTLLRSGSLAEFHPLGAVGKPVYSAASQLRAAVRRLYGSETADLFAIPKRHDRGDVIDWYAPVAGFVVPWSAATPEERAAALAALQSARDRLAVHSQALQGAEETSERRTFGKLLAQATRIPSNDHIYLVNGRPVITFWGFHPLNAPTGFDVIGGLTAGAVPVAAAADGGTGAATDPTAAVTPRRRWWWWLPLLLALLLLLLLVGLKSCGVPIPYGAWLPTLPLLAPSPPAMPASENAPPDLKPVRDAAGRPVLQADGSALYIDAAGRAVAVYGDGRRVMVDAAGRPGTAGANDASPPADPARLAETIQPRRTPPDAATNPAETAPPAAPDDAKGQAPTDEPGPSAGPGKGMPAGTPPGGRPDGVAPPGTPLAIPDTAVRAGDTGFLNGAWRSISGLQDKSGNPVDLSYDFQNGQGPVTLRRSIGGQQQTCSGSVGAAMEGGRLMLNQGEVRCPDGTVFQKSRVVCVAGTDGQAKCQGLNENGSTYDVDIVK